MALVTAVLRHDEDLDDPYLALPAWWVLEANLDRDREAVMALFEDPDFSAGTDGGQANSEATDACPGFEGKEP